MSTTDIKIPAPGKPWQASRSDRLKSFLTVISAGTFTFIFVNVTPLKGKLAYFIVFFISVIVFEYIRQRITRDSQAAKDSVLSTLSTLGMVLIMIPIFSIIFTVFINGYKGLHWQILNKDMALASVNDPLEAGGLLHAVLGTFLLVFVALLISFPVGLLTGIYLTEIRGTLSSPIRFLVQAMSGVPSIVAGLFILSAVIYPITNSLSGFMGSLALTILMIPTIARTAEEVLKLIPDDLREAGVALGATQWRTVAMVVVPAAKSGLLTAVILGIARIIGETAPILLVTGGADKTNLNPFEGSMGSLPFYIWKAFLTGGTEQSIARGWAGMLILLIFIFILFGSARYISGRRS